MVNHWLRILLIAFIIPNAYAQKNEALDNLDPDTRQAILQQAAKLHQEYIRNREDTLREINAQVVPFIEGSPSSKIIIEPQANPMIGPPPQVPNWSQPPRPTPSTPEKLPPGQPAAPNIFITPGGTGTQPTQPPNIYR